MTVVPPIVAACTAVKDKRAALVESSSESGGSGGSGGTGGGGQGAAGSAAGSGSSTPRAGWFCMNVSESCACVEAAGLTGECAVKPPCCFALTMVGLNTCQCWPENSEPCRDLRAGAADKKAIASCPP